MDNARTPKMTARLTGVGTSTCGMFRFSPTSAPKLFNVLIHGQQHLEANKDQDDAKSVFQILEVFGHSSQAKPLAILSSECWKWLPAFHSRMVLMPCAVSSSCCLRMQLPT